MAQKICMVTGASSGIGKATSGKLAGLGADVVMVSRTKDRGEDAVGDIKDKNPDARVELLLADFSSLDSVRSLAREFSERHDALHVLVNNAGVAQVRRSVTVDGFETTFEVDYLSHFLLTNLLLDPLKKGAPSRIVNVSSVAHYGGHLDFDDLQMERGYEVMRAYSRAKLAQVLFTYELARRLEGTGVTANCLHPGAVATNIWGRSLGPFSFVGNVTKLFLVSPEKGSETSVYLASSPEVQGVTGKYYDQMREKKSSADSYDVGLAERLWTESEKLVGLYSQNGTATN
jgi:NAD(P)-dependent dehydrogenase (short-subunit alcohol dehydrogenase family)